MDGSPFYPVISQTIVWAIVGVMFTLLHLEAKRRGSSVWRNIGAEGWGIAFLLIGAATLVGAAASSALVLSLTSAADWSTWLVEGPILATAGVVLFLVLRRFFIRALARNAIRPESSLPLSSAERRVLIVAILLVVAALAGSGIVLWYPTSLQPAISITAAGYALHACAPVPTGLANVFNWTFTLANAGNADGNAWIGVELNGSSFGYRVYLAPQHSSVTENTSIYGWVFSTKTACGLPGAASIWLASVDKV